MAESVVGRVAEIRARADALVSKFTPYRLAEKLAGAEVATLAILDRETTLLAELAAATTRAAELERVIKAEVASHNRTAMDARHETARADTAEREARDLREAVLSQSYGIRLDAAVKYDERGVAEREEQ